MLSAFKGIQRLSHPSEHGTQTLGFRSNPPVPQAGNWDTGEF